MPRSSSSKASFFFRTKLGYPAIQYDSSVIWRLATLHEIQYNEGDHQSQCHDACSFCNSYFQISKQHTHKCDKSNKQEAPSAPTDVDISCSLQKFQNLQKGGRGEPQSQCTVCIQNTVKPVYRIQCEFGSWDYHHQLCLGMLGGKQKQEKQVTLWATSIAKNPTDGSQDWKKNDEGLRLFRLGHKTPNHNIQDPTS